MKTVLCFGDSLTWGSRPDGGARHKFEDRWPNVLQAGLEGVNVISDGLRGRTTAMDQHASPGNMNGAALLPSALHTHAPLDLVIVSLGANDVYWGFPLRRAVRGLEHLAEIVRGHPMRVPDIAQPKVLLVIPQVLVPCDDPHVTAELLAASRQFSALAKAKADDIGVPWFDAGSVAQSSPIDGIHLDAENTRAIGHGLVPVVQELLGP